MELLSNSTFDIKDYCGNIVLLYTEDSAEHIAALREILDYTGYAYLCQPIDRYTVERRNFVEEADRTLNGCACLIPVLSKSLLLPENQIFRSLYWYSVGYMRANSHEAIVPLCFGEDKVDLAGTPLQGIDIIYDTDTLMQTLSDKFSSRILRYNYYENRTVNLYASRRIFYRCLHMRFKIYESSFQNAKQCYKEYTSHRISDNDFDEYLSENLVCGARVISFGMEEHLDAPMLPYREEVHPYVTDYPKTITGKKSYCILTDEERENTGVRAEFNIDVLLPVHRLLGTYFKCYFSLHDSECPVSFLLALLESDFTKQESEDFCGDIPEELDYWYNIYPENIYIDDKLGRFYFSSGLTNVNEITPDAKFGVGNTIDYVYPQ